jgi:hypothetical protein
MHVADGQRAGAVVSQPEAAGHALAQPLRQAVIAVAMSGV